MKIECPSCHLIGQISDASVPSEGLPLDCPRCKNRFVVKQELPADLQPGDAVNSCPACQYSTFSEETFVKCPRCGVIPRDYRAGAGERQARERQKEEEIRRQYAKDATQPEEPDNGGMAMTAEAPVPVMIIGWLAIIAAVLLLIFGFKGLIAYSSIPQPVPDPYATELPPSAGAIFLQHGLAPLLQLGYAALVLYSASLFLKLKGTGRLLMEIAAWLGLFGVLAGQGIDLLAWISRGSGSGGYLMVGVFNFFLGAVLWLIPLLVGLWFLRGDMVRDEMVD